METVAPSLIVRTTMRPMTKVLNPLMARFAGGRRLPLAAQLRHTGRKSGRPYVTTVGARVHGDVIIIPLTFGNTSDWSRNVAAAGGCSVTILGEDYQATGPEFLDRQQAAPLTKAAFRPLERAGFRLLGIRQFMLLHITVSPTRIPMS
jgi:deazaflavin-dependent oxidoreductase (nitroreductase family)